MDKNEAVIEFEFKEMELEVGGIGLVISDANHPERFPTKIEVQIKGDDGWEELKSIEFDHEKLD